MAQDCFVPATHALRTHPLSPPPYQPQVYILALANALLSWSLGTELGADVAFQGRSVVRRPGSQDFQIVKWEVRNVMAYVHGPGNIHQKDSCHEITVSLSH